MTLQRWEVAGCPREPDADGRTQRFDLERVARWLSDRLTGKLEAKTEGETLEEARRRDARAKADLSELERGERTGELIRAQRVYELVTNLGAQTRLGLERIPDRLADRLAAEASADGCRRLIVGELDQVLDELVDGAAAIAKELSNG